MLKRKVYILDYEMISPIANGAGQVIESIRSGMCAEQSVQRVDTSGIPFKKAAEIKFSLEQYYEDEPDALKKACITDRKLELIAASYGKASQRLQPFIEKLVPEETGVILGVGADVVPIELFEDQINDYLAKGLNPISELEFELNDNNLRLNTTNNAYDIHAIYLANKFNAAAFQKSILTACVSSTQAIAFGADSIWEKEAEVVIAGGTDSLINLVALTSFGKLGVIPESSEEISCKPFDVIRNGALAGECAGFVILASEDFVQKHNLTPVAEFLGYGNTLDAYKITAPDPEGTSIVRAIKNAVNNSGISVDMIDYINAHGTGTKHNDQLELKSLLEALGEEVKNIPISSTKDRHGHAIAAAGIQEVCVLLELMKHSTIPSNLNLKTPCEEDFNLVRETYSAPIRYALSNNFSFGGINTVLALKNERI